MDSREISELTEYMRATGIFTALSAPSLRSIASGAFITEYARGEAVRGGGAVFSGIGFVMSGSLSVRKGKTIISTLTAGDTFGAAELYGGGIKPPSDISAKSECTIAVIGKEEIDSLIKTNPDFARSYISYLSGRIAFLTDRIEAVTGGTADEKLKAFLLNAQGGSIDCTNMSLLAKKLDMSRASLYRAVDSLEKAGLIIRTEEKITLIG